MSEGTLVRITPDTRLCLSLAGRPGSFGTRFHNHLYDALGLDFVYKAFTTTDLPAAVGGIRALGVRGFAVSMPFKEAVIPLVDELDPSAARIASVNTVVNDDGRLTAYNTDYLALRELLGRVGPAGGLTFALRGSGGMAKAAAAALVDAGFAGGTVVARNRAEGTAMADRLGLTWASDVDDVRADVLLNATPIGMTGGPEADDLSFPTDAVAEAALVFDVVAKPSQTPLVRAANAAGRPVVTGADVIALQALEQFVLYTGVRPEPELVAAATAYALG